MLVFCRTVLNPSRIRGVRGCLRGLGQSHDTLDFCVGLRSFRDEIKLKDLMDGGRMQVTRYLVAFN